MPEGTVGWQRADAAYHAGTRMTARSALAWAVVLLVGGCGVPRAVPDASPSPQRPARISVVTSFYPLYEFSKRVGGDAVVVRNLVPAGAEPHDFEPTARDVAALNAAQVLVYNGAGFEPWIEKLVPTLPATVQRINTTAGLPLVEGAHGGGPDPHVWLDPVLAGRQVDRVAAGLAHADRDRTATYEANAAALRADLLALHQRYGQTLQGCRKKTIVTTHAAFGYLARRYGLTMIAIAGLSPEAEPSPARLRQVLAEVRMHGIRVIYFETLVSPKVAQTIAREVGARTLVLNPVEGLTPDQQVSGATYFTVMDENLRNLAEGLDCR
jgi:zinc transport system substrate-binding protein